MAVVGAGPWGVYCAERLALAAARARRPVRVTLFDDGVPGHGPNFRPGLPDHDVLNYPVGHVAPWADGPTALPEVFRSAVGWIRATHGVDLPPDDPAPRRLVGAFFAAALAALTEDAGPAATVRLEARRVVGATWMEDGGAGAGGPGWRVRTAGGAAHRPDDGPPEADDGIHAADHLALVTGVAFRSAPDAEARRLRAFAQRHGLTVVDRWRDLDGADVEAGAPVAVRGLGISFVDVALDLTEGRGGRFEPAGRGGGGAGDDDSGPERTRLRYVPSGREPRPILAFSRSGRLPAPKTRGPWPYRDEDPPRVFDEATAARLAALGRPLDFDGDVWPLVLAEMGGDVDAVLEGADGVTPSGGSGRGGPVDPVMLARAASALPGAGDDAWHDRVLAALRRDIAQAERGHDGTARTAVIETWARVFPAMARAVSHGRLAADSQRRFDREVRPAWDALAFGPPLANARKMEALLAGGWIDLSLARDGAIEADDARGVLVVRSGRASAAVRHFVDARIPRFDLERGAQPLYEELALAGHLTRFVNRAGGGTWAPGGVAVDERAFAVPAPGGTRVPLAVVGAPTEGCVVGTDALPGTRSSRVHAWAEAVLGEV